MKNINKTNRVIKNYKEKGLTLLEALISTAIVGIGFIAVFQLVNFSVNSINVSAERTKINYITTMIAEDILGSRDSLMNTNPDRNTIAINEYGEPVNPDGSRSSKVKFPEWLESTGWTAGQANAVCSANKGKFLKLADIESVYLNSNVNLGSPENKVSRWNQIIGEDRYLKCQNNKDIKSVKVYKICDSGPDCLAPPNATVNDELYIGRVQINTSGGKKRKFLYFQADYIFKR